MPTSPELHACHYFAPLPKFRDRVSRTTCARGRIEVMERRRPVVRSRCLMVSIGLTATMVASGCTSEGREAAPTTVQTLSTTTVPVTTATPVEPDRSPPGWCWTSSSPRPTNPTPARSPRRHGRRPGQDGPSHQQRRSTSPPTPRQSTPRGHQPQPDSKQPMRPHPPRMPLPAALSAKGTLNLTRVGLTSKCLHRSGGRRPPPGLFSLRQICR